jgi:hypothetical protein
MGELPSGTETGRRNAREHVDRVDLFGEDLLNRLGEPGHTA